MTSLNAYAKWDKIELSDDECDDLPKMIDKDSFKKYQKSKRTQRDEEELAKCKSLKESISNIEKQLKQLGVAGRKHQKGVKLTEQIESEKKELEKLEKKINSRLNADKLIENEQYSNTVLSSVAEKKEGYKNSNVPKIDDNVDIETFEKFATDNEKILKTWIEDLAEQPLYKSCRFLLEGSNPEILLSSDCETFCMFHCLGLEMEGETERMKKAARQQQLIYQSLNLSRAMNNPNPEGKIESSSSKKITLNRKATENMLQKLEDNDEDLQSSFNTSVRDFIERIKIRAKEKNEEERLEKEAKAKELDEKMKKMNISAKNKSDKDSDSTPYIEEVDDNGNSITNAGSNGSGSGKSPKKDPPPPATDTLGPGGLNAQEVFDTLPENLQEAFIEKNPEKLQAAFASLPGNQASEIMQRCIAGGLWVLPGQEGDGDRDTDSEGD